MAAVTGKRLDHTYVPGLFLYEVTADDGDTFTPEHVSSVDGVIVAWAEDPATGNPVAGVVSGKTITIECTGASGKKFNVLVFGK